MPSGFMLSASFHSGFEKLDLVFSSLVYFNFDQEVGLLFPNIFSDEIQTLSLDIARHHVFRTCRFGGNDTTDIA